MNKYLYKYTLSKSDDECTVIYSIDFKIHLTTHLLYGPRIINPIITEEELIELEKSWSSVKIRNQTISNVQKVDYNPERLIQLVDGLREREDLEKQINELTNRLNKIKNDIQYTKF
jgi:hypothetical protein